MRVFYLYAAFICGGVLVALIYIRGAQRGWPSTIAFFLVLAAIAFYAVQRSRRNRSEEAEDTGEADSSSRPDGA